MADRLLGLWVRIPPGAWMCFLCFVLRCVGRGFCDELIIRSDESYWGGGVCECVCVRERETERERQSVCVCVI